VLAAVNTAIFASLSLSLGVSFWKTEGGLFRLLKRTPDAMFGMGCIPIALGALVNGIVIFGQDEAFFASKGARDVLLTLATGLWVLQAVVSVAVAVTIPSLAARKCLAASGDPRCLLAIVPPEVAAATGGLLAQHLESEARVSAVLCLALALLGMSLGPAFAALGKFADTVSREGLPVGESALTAMIVLGPLGMCATALCTLSAAGRALAALTEAGSGLHDLAATAPALGLLALGVWGYGFWWLGTAYTALAVAVGQRRAGLQPPFLTWSIVFPNGAFTVATLLLHRETDVPFFRLVGQLLVVFQFILLAYAAALTPQMIRAPRPGGGVVRET